MITVPAGNIGFRSVVVVVVVVVVFVKKTRHPSVVEHFPFRRIVVVFRSVAGTARSGLPVTGRIVAMQARFEMGRHETVVTDAAMVVDVDRRRRFTAARADAARADAARVDAALTAVVVQGVERKLQELRTVRHRVRVNAAAAAAAAERFVYFAFLRRFQFVGRRFFRAFYPFPGGRLGLVFG